MDINVIPTLGGGVLLVAIWGGVLFGRLYLNRLRRIERRRGEPPAP